MARRPAVRPERSRPSIEAHRPGGHNPRNRPLPELDASPAQPDAPAQAPVEEQQDQQPLNPAPLLDGARNPSRGTPEEKNG